MVEEPALEDVSVAVVAAEPDDFIVEWLPPLEVIEVVSSSDPLGAIVGEGVSDVLVDIVATVVGAADEEDTLEVRVC
jgi:uncharacterized MnhB-related membrane protein